MAPWPAWQRLQDLPAAESQVRNGAHKCLGYHQPRTFISFGTGQVSPPTSVVADATLSTSGDDVVKSKSGDASLLSTVTAIDSDVSTAILRARHTVFDVPSTLSLVAFKNSIVISHFMANFMINSPENSAHSDPMTVSAILYNSNASPAAYTSGLSVAEAFFGRLHRIDEMAEQSAQHYSQALRKLREELQGVGQSASRLYANLWAYTNGWPAFLPNPFGEKAVVGAITQRRRSFLEESAWKTIPWRLEPHTKSIASMLQDVLCDVPGLMEDADTLISTISRGSESTHNQYDALRDRILDTHRLLDCLRWKWEAKNPLVCWEVAPTNGDSVSQNPDGKPLFPTVLHFLQQDLAIEAVYFSVARLLLHSVSDTAGLPLASTPQLPATRMPMGPFSNPLLLPGQGSRQDHALDICRAVDFLILGQHGTHGSLTLLFPLRVAFGHLEGRPDVRRWLQGLLVEMSTSKGFDLQNIKIREETLAGLRMSLDVRK
ncbi:hypothetical protein G7046_g6366 [Stylonectria norvegica]|nr:hypothetical protein G7046_g6366 [Stylonectria norvegica]